ncbi:MAG: TIGR01777 family oxidoreductase [Chitinophagales bacterium]
MKKVLVTGASGAIGAALLPQLVAQGYQVHVLGRTLKTPQSSIHYFQWDVAAGIMDEKALDGVEGIIHLAGAGVADQRWTAARKREILDSRVNSTRMLIDFLRKGNHQVRRFVCASAVGYYGDTGGDWISETHQPAKTFLAAVCEAWEAAAQEAEKLGIAAVSCRIGIVLDATSGALPELIKTLPLGVAGYFAKSPLFYPWIHVQDIAAIFVHAVSNESMRGIYNATAPHPVSQREIVAASRKILGSHAVMLPVPKPAVQLLVGEMADMLFCSQRCSADKLLKTGFVFRFPQLEEALSDLLKTKN